PNESIKWSRAALKKAPDSESAMSYLATALVTSKQNLGEATQLITKIEAKRGANDQLVVELKRMLQEAQAGGDAATTQSPSKTMLQHGPEAAKGDGVKK
ncbi:MAG TPA: hypothetical protein VEF04_17965, partial [Blastocatellia bacterium]|nr:hypothetical protein [Blastocatellia bacterium]